MTDHQHQVERRILGIDPGLKGGLAVVNCCGTIVWSSVMPLDQDKRLDVPALSHLCRGVKLRFNVDAAILEKVWAFPGQGVSSMFSFGTVYGAIQGCLAGAGIAYKLVTPQEWTKTLCAGFPSALEPKERGLMAARKLFPGESFLATKRSSVPHSGLVDAALLGWYGILKSL